MHIKSMLVDSKLNCHDRQEIERLIDQFPDKTLNLFQLWKLIDQVWDEIGCNNQNLNNEKLESFYKHPVWILNGFFAESDNESLEHRNAMSNWIVQNVNNPNGTILDFGGGLGALARMIVGKANALKVDIYEPYPSDFAISQCNNYPSINFVTDICKKYDCVVTIDVLEHVPDPLTLLGKMIKSVNLGGYLIIANCFYPVIKCHLPSTFHLRYTSDEFAEAMGLKVVEPCKGSHATIYQKVSDRDIDWDKINRMEIRSKLFYTFREFKQKKISSWQYRFKKILKYLMYVQKSLFKKG